LHPVFYFCGGYLGERAKIKVDEDKIKNIFLVF
jgi:hypothetical protein